MRPPEPVFISSTEVWAMAELKEIQVGRTEQKSDIFLILRKRESGGLSIHLKSSVAGLFGDQIRKRPRGARSSELGVKNAEVVAEGPVRRPRLRHPRRGSRRPSGGCRRSRSRAGCCPQRAAPIRAPKRARLRRTRPLYLPGNDPNLMLNAGLFGADEMILDLESSVAPRPKRTRRACSSATRSWRSISARRRSSSASIRPSRPSTARPTSR